MHLKCVWRFVQRQVHVSKDRCYYVRYESKFVFSLRATSVTGILNFETMVRNVFFLVKVPKYISQKPLSPNCGDFLFKIWDGDSLRLYYPVPNKFPTATSQERHSSLPVIYFFFGRTGRLPNEKWSETIQLNKHGIGQRKKRSDLF